MFCFVIKENNTNCLFVKFGFQMINYLIFLKQDESTFQFNIFNMLFI
jgi:hypothetical protein